MTTVAAYSTAEWFLLSAFPHPLSLGGLTERSNDIAEVRKHRSPALEVLGVVFTNVDGRATRLRAELETVVHQALPGRRFDPYISQAVSLNKVSGHKQPRSHDQFGWDRLVRRTIHDYGEKVAITAIPILERRVKSTTVLKRKDATKRDEMRRLANEPRCTYRVDVLGLPCASDVWNHLLPKLDAVGSNPFARYSFHIKHLHSPSDFSYRRVRFIEAGFHR